MVLRFAGFTDSRGTNVSAQMNLQAGDSFCGYGTGTTTMPVKKDRSLQPMAKIVSGLRSAANCNGYSTGKEEEQETICELMQEISLKMIRNGCEHFT